MSQKCIRGGKSRGEKCCNFQQLMRRKACLVSIRCELRVKNSSQQCDKDVFNNGVNQYHSTHSASLIRVRRRCRVNDDKNSKMCDRKSFGINCYVLRYYHIFEDLSCLRRVRKEKKIFSDESTYPIDRQDGRRRC